MHPLSWRGKARRSTRASGIGVDLNSSSCSALRAAPRSDAAPLLACRLWSSVGVENAMRSGRFVPRSRVSAATSRLCATGLPGRFSGAKDPAWLVCRPQPKLLRASDAKFAHGAPTLIVCGASGGGGSSNCDPMASNAGSVKRGGKLLVCPKTLQAGSLRPCGLAKTDDRADVTRVENWVAACGMWRVASPTSLVAATPYSPTVIDLRAGLCISMAQPFEVSGASCQFTLFSRPLAGRTEWSHHKPTPEMLGVKTRPARNREAGVSEEGLAVVAEQMLHSLILFARLQALYAMTGKHGSGSGTIQMQ